MNHRTAIFRPLALTFLMALPFGFGVGFLATGVYEGWREFKREVLGIRGWADYEHRSLGFLADGTPVIRDNRSHGGRQWQDLHTRLDGTPIEADERDAILHPQRLRSPHSSRRRHLFDKEPFEDLLSNRNRWGGFRDPEKGAIHWAWEPAGDSSTDRVLVARYRASNAAVWFVTPDGFLPWTPQLADDISGFHHPENWMQDGELVGFLSDGRLMAVNLIDRTVSAVADVHVNEDRWAMFEQNEEAGWRFVVQSSDGLTVYAEQGEKLFTYPANGTAEGRSDFYTPTTGGFIVTNVESRHQDRLPGGGQHYRTNLVAMWLDKSGNVTRTLRFQNEYRSQPAESPSALVNAIDWFMNSIGPGLVAPEPAVICGAIFVLVPWVSSSVDAGRPASRAIHDVLQEIPYAIPVSAVVALCCAIACWRRQRKYQADWTKTWVVFVFLFGLPAWIAWRVHRRWPPPELAGLHDTEFAGAEPNGLEIW